MYNKMRPSAYLPRTTSPLWWYKLVHCILITHQPTCCFACLPLVDSTRLPTFSFLFSGFPCLWLIKTDSSSDHSCESFPQIEISLSSTSVSTSSAFTQALLPKVHLLYLHLLLFHLSFTLRQVSLRSDFPFLVQHVTFPAMISSDFFAAPPFYHRTFLD